MTNRVPQPENGWRVIEGFCDAEDMDSPKKIVDLYMVRGSITLEDRSFWLCWEHAPATGPARAARWARYAGRELVRRFPWRLWCRLALALAVISVGFTAWAVIRRDTVPMDIFLVCAVANLGIAEMCLHNARKQPPPRSGGL